jgi:mannonate dehydratase
MEAFPDEGDMDMARALAAYRDVGYPYMLMPDHVPQIDGRDPSGVAFAYCYGYIQALLDALVPRPTPQMDRTLALRDNGFRIPF